MHSCIGLGFMKPPSEQCVGSTPLAPDGALQRQTIVTASKPLSVEELYRAGQYPVDGPAAAQLVEDSDDVLFSRIHNSAHHVLRELLPHPNTHDYELRPGAITCH